MSTNFKVGHVYDHERKRYDHHQPSFKETFTPQHNIKMSSAGLIYKHYGREILEEQIAAILFDVKDKIKFSVEMTEADYALLYDELYSKLFKGLDAIDNGIDMYPNQTEPAYTINSSIVDRIARTNSSWNLKDQHQDILFNRAMELAADELY